MADEIKVGMILKEVWMEDVGGGFYEKQECYIFITRRDIDPEYSDDIVVYFYDIKDPSREMWDYEEEMMGRYEHI